MGYYHQYAYLFIVVAYQSFPLNSLPQPSASISAAKTSSKSSLFPGIANVIIEPQPTIWWLLCSNNGKDSFLRMRASARNKLFSLMLCLLISAPAVVHCIDSVANGALPEWPTSEDAKYLPGGERKASNSIQGRIESAIDNNMPCRSIALLGASALQRTFIRSLNTVFQWSCYPTYYGSSVADVPSHDALIYIPSSESPDWIDLIKAFSYTPCCFAESHPNIDFCVVVPGEIDFSEANPVNKLISDATYTKDYP